MCEAGSVVNEWLRSPNPLVLLGNWDTGLPSCLDSMQLLDR
jgi:hypothetical protein